MHDELRQALLVLLLCGAIACGATPGFIGTWSVTRLLGFAEVSAGSDVQARSLVGSVFKLHPREPLQFGGMTCHPSLVVKVVKRGDILNDWKVDEATLRLPATIREVDLDCTNMVLRDNNHGVLDWEGALFEVVRRPYSWR